jgi:hypothetical protein
VTSYLCEVFWLLAAWIFVAATLAIDRDGRYGMMGEEGSKAKDRSVGVK